ncbi:hypothetical protein FQN60_006192 [Etheostoma spectabile]|uniref:Uncharacterized protein n=1 Tax=Etheostoma spectabile TaxID=54343 RepID=A0A5J5CSM0_9PERO|nr:hypothetical protein FQN60_006192 [Etheostoma spectabile]
MLKKSERSQNRQPLHSSIQGGNWKAYQRKQCTFALLKTLPTAVSALTYSHLI